MAIFSTFARYFCRSVKGKANIIIQHYLVPHRLSTDPKHMTLNDLEWPFYVKFFVEFRFNIYLFTYTDSVVIYMMKARIIYSVKVTCMRAGSSKT